MSFQWLQSRIGEERDRRAREAQILERLPPALDELQQNLAACVDSFNKEFGDDSAAVTRRGLRLTVNSESRRSEVVADKDLPGFQIESPGGTLAVQIGVLPGDRLFYLDTSADQYLSMDDLTRRILDRVLFPKLRE